MYTLRCKLISFIKEKYMYSIKINTLQMVDNIKYGITTKYNKNNI